VWTDVVQVALLIGGGLFVLGYVAVVTHSTPMEWIATVQERATNEQFKTFSLDPTIPATTTTLMLQMLVWHVCTHSANQMMLQRYFSTKDVRAGRRSFLTGSLLGIFLNLMLAAVGAALVYYYTQGPEQLPSSVDVTKGVDRDAIFPRFVVTRIPPGFTGGIFAALLAAAMSTIDSGVNSIATVATVDFRRKSKANSQADHVRGARIITFVVGLLVTVAAIALDSITGTSDILSMMPKSFNCFLGALGAVFLVGMFLPRAGTLAAWVCLTVGLASALFIAYSKELLTLLKPHWYTQSVSWFGEEFAARLFSQGLGFTWVLPLSCLLAIVSAFLVSLVAPANPQRAAKGVTWWTRHEPFEANQGAAG
jgi:SSS family solute:Na+ symporter